MKLLMACPWKRLMPSLKLCDMNAINGFQHDGRIIERGTHDELVKLDGEYADLYERQLLEEELEVTD